MRRLLIFPLLVFSCLAFSKPTKFEVRDALLRDLMEWTFEAPLEKWVGIHPTVWGYIELDPENLNAGIKGEFEFDARAMETGSQARNDFIKEKLFLAQENPVGVLTLGKPLNISKPKLSDQQPVSIRLQSTLKWRGMSKNINLLGKWTFFKESEITKQRLMGNLLKMSLTFDVDLGAFGVSFQGNSKYKMPRYSQVSIDLVGTDATPPSLRPESPVGNPPAQNPPQK